MLKTPIAIYNLWHQGAKTLVSIGGVAFALLLVFMQLGFIGAVSFTATNLLSNLRFDAMIRARDYVHLYEPGKVERRWLEVARNTPGVKSADPFWLTIHNWRRLDQANTRSLSFQNRYLPLAVMAATRDSNVFLLPELSTAFAAGQLSSASHILIDTSSHIDYGPMQGRRFSESDRGTHAEIGGKRFEIVGTYALGTGLAANGAVTTSERGFSRISPWDTNEWISIGLIELEGDTLQKANTMSLLRSRLSLSNQPLSDANLNSDSESGVVTLLNRDQAFEREQYRWLWQTPLGLIFQLGVVISLLVGGAIVYMILSTDVANRLAEYATLLAIGYSRIYLASIVMTQAIVLSLLGFSVAWLLAEILYRVTFWYTNIPLTMDMQRVLLVLLLGIIMCCISGLLALRKLWKAEPANLF